MQAFSVDLAAIKYYHFEVADLQDLIMLLFLLQVTPVQEVLKFIVKNADVEQIWNKVLKLELPTE
jgi:aminomethyltransferase